MPTMQSGIVYLDDTMGPLKEYSEKFNGHTGDKE